jgi:hypothetical protein
MLILIDETEKVIKHFDEIEPISERRERLQEEQDTF